MVYFLPLSHPEPVFAFSTSLHASPLSTSFFSLSLVVCPLLLHLYAQYSDSAINQFGPGRPNVRTLVKPLLGLFHCEPGAGKWRRLIDTEIRQAKTIDHLLSLTLHAFPPHVLDAPPSSFLSHPTSPSSPTLATPPPAPAPALSAGG
ncbi:hypothetical protein CLOM_g2373 [Closterium sp. NIES-68]|nr:hypothetical protein CLOM_g2373 [Closterium sp. NIES-68]